MTGIGEILEEYPRMTYVVPFVSVLLAYFMFPWLNLFQTDPDSARYMISALVQSEAAIIAVVISLSLVAVQLTASSYSPRVTGIFKEAKDLWFLIGLYIFAIVFGLAVLKLIADKNSSNYEIYILLVYYLSVFVFTALIPYLWIILNLLKPSTIIEKFANDITKENLLREDPILPIIDIVRGAIMKYDYETTRNGLNMIKYKLCNIFENEKFSKEDEEKIAIKIYNYFIGGGMLATGRMNEISAIDIIENIGEIGETVADKELDEILSSVLLFFVDFSKELKEKKYGGAYMGLLKKLENIEEKTKNKEIQLNIIANLALLSKANNKGLMS